MRRLIYFFIPMFLLISSVMAYNFSFTGPTDLGIGELKDRMKCWQHPTTDNWYCSYLLDSDDDIYVEEFSSTYISQASDKVVCGGATDALNLDCNYYNNITDNNIDCLCGDTGNTGAQDAEIFRFSYTSESFYLVDNQQQEVGHRLMHPAVVNDYIITDSPVKLWYSSMTSGQPRYTATDDINDFDGDGNINLPAIYVGQPLDLQAAYCNDYYYFFITNTTNGNLYALSYDVSYSYNSVTNLGSIFNVTDNNYNIWKDPNENVIYMARVNSTYFGGDYPVLIFSSYICDDSGFLDLGFSEAINQTDLHANANFTAGSFIEKPFLTKDQYDVFTLFYQYNDGGSYSTHAVQNDDDCVCGGWIDQAECIDDLQKHNRTCVPTGCDGATEDWNYTLYCAVQYNETRGIYQQRNRTYKRQSICTVEGGNPFIDLPWAGGDQLIGCSPEPLEIPVDCDNVEVTEAATAYFTGNECDVGNYTLKACSPTWNCTSQIFPCSQFEGATISITDYTNFIPGTIADGYSELFVEPQCGCGLIVQGIDDFRLHESLTVECSMNCGEFGQPLQVCINEDWEAWERVDCQIVNRTRCLNGCQLSGSDEGRTQYYMGAGSCYGNVIESDLTPASIGWWITFFTQPSEIQQMIHAAIWPIFFALAAVGISHHVGLSTNTAIVFLMTYGIVFVVFILLGFVPTWIVLILIAALLGGVALKNLT